MRVMALLLAVATALPAAAASGARTERLADGVYAIIHEDSTHEWPSGGTSWPHGNTLVVVGEENVLVVDTTFLPDRAEADIALIRSLTPKPVRYVVNTHWHGDHTHGNGVYRRAFPGLSIIGPSESRSYIGLNLERAPRAMTDAESGLRKRLAELEALLAAGGDPAEMTRLRTNIEERRHELQQLERVEIVAPDVLFDRELTLLLGRRRVEIRNRGRANSPADVTVYLPEEQILATGDILVHPVPYAMQGYPTHWSGVLRELEAIPVKAIVPGHGPVLRDHSYTAKVRNLVETALARVEQSARKGTNSEKVQTLVRLDDLRPQFVADSDAAGIELWDYSIQSTLLERAWACLVGYRC